MVFSEERIEVSGKTVLWHKSCFSSYTCRKNLASVQLGMEESKERTVETTNVSSDTESSGRPATRMSLDATVNWELCLFCQQASYKKDRKLYNVVTYDACTKIKAAAKRQQDQRILTIVSHDEFVLIPYEGKYHKDCHNKYLKAQKKESGDGGKVSEYDSAFYKLIEKIDSKLQSGRALDMNYLNIRLFKWIWILMHQLRQPTGKRN